MAEPFPPSFLPRLKGRKARNRPAFFSCATKRPTRTWESPSSGAQWRGDRPTTREVLFARIRRPFKVTERQITTDRTGTTFSGAFGLERRCL